MLSLITTSSGHSCLNLSEQVSWEDFPEFADELLKHVRGVAVGFNEAVDIRIWDVIVHGRRLQLVFDDFPNMVSLESQDSEGNDVVRRVFIELESRQI